MTLSADDSFAPLCPARELCGNAEPCGTERYGRCAWRALQGRGDSTGRDVLGYGGAARRCDEGRRQRARS